MNSALRTILPAMLLLSGCSPPEAPAPRVRIATTTSVEHSGLLDQVRATFRADTGIEIEAHVVGSGRAFDLARTGEADLAITHEPKGEAELIRSGLVEEQAAFMANEFILVGPPENPALVPGGATLAAGMLRVHEAGATFLSRGDDSGTHAKELEIWRKVGADPRENPGYRQMGQGMSALLRSASEMQGYALADEATYEALRPVVRLEECARGGEGSRNVYLVSLMRDRKGVVKSEARALFDWLVSERGQGVIEAFGRARKGRFAPLVREKPKRISYDGMHSAAGEMGSSEVVSHQSGPGSTPIPEWQNRAE